MTAPSRRSELPSRDLGPLWGRRLGPLGPRSGAAGAKVWGRTTTIGHRRQRWLWFKQDLLVYEPKPGGTCAWSVWARRGVFDTCRVMTAPIVVAHRPALARLRHCPPQRIRCAMADQRLLFKALSDFAHTLVLRYAVADVLFRLTDHVTDVLDVAGAGVSLGDKDGHLRFITASNELITEIERVQELAQHGACVDAYQSSVIVQCDDLTTETRWSELVPDALRLGLRSVVAIPMRLSDASIGSLNVYDVRRRNWRDDDLQAAQLLADMAVSYVVNASDLERSERVRAQLQQALDSRVVIEQAKGMIAAEQEVGVDEAFKRLRQHARTRNASLHSVAEAVVNLGLRIN